MFPCEINKFQRISDEKKRLASSKSVIQLLPHSHYIIMQQLCSFLNRLASHSSQNKMTAEKLAIVFSPNLLKTNLPLSQISHLEYVQEVKNHSTKLLATLITKSTEIFPQINEQEQEQTQSQASVTDEVDHVLNYRDKFIRKEDSSEDLESTSVKRIGATRFGNRLSVKGQPVVN